MGMTPNKIAAAFDTSRMAYIRAIEANEIAELPNEALANIGDMDALFVLTDGEGQKLAIIEGREAAFAAARANSFLPVSLH